MKLRCGALLWLALVGCGSRPTSHALVVAPAGAADAALPTVHVTVSQWTWAVACDDGGWESELRLPVGRPYVLELESTDRAHSLVVEGTDVSIPVAARETTRWRIEARSAAELRSRCEVSCPDDPAVPFSLPIHLMPPSEFDGWVASRSVPPTDRTMAALGREHFRRDGCTACHGIVASPLDDMLGAERTLADGTTVRLDADHIDAYLRDAILHPAPGSLMPAFRMSPLELDAVVAYIRCRDDDCASRSECAGACGAD